MAESKLAKKQTKKFEYDETLVSNLYESVIVTFEDTNEDNYQGYTLAYYGVRGWSPNKFPCRKSESRPFRTSEAHNLHVQ